MGAAFLVSQGGMSSGGQGVFVHSLPRELARLGHEVHVIAGLPFPEGDEGGHIHKLRTYPMGDFLIDRTVEDSRLLRLIDDVGNHVLPKSMVLYARKPSSRRSG